MKTGEENIRNKEYHSKSFYYYVDMMCFIQALIHRVKLQWDPPPRPIRNSITLHLPLKLWLAGLSLDGLLVVIAVF